MEGKPSWLKSITRQVRLDHIKVLLSLGQT